MLFVPYYTCTLVHDLPPDEITRRVGRAIDPVLRKRDWLVFDATREFRGTIGTNTFKVRRSINGRKPLIPIVTGTIERQNDRSHIHLVMTIPLVETVTLSAFALLMLILSPSLIVLLIPFYLFLYLIGFVLEKDKALDFVKNILNEQD